MEENQEAERPEYSAVTDAEGRFTIEDVKAGAYRVRYDHAGFVDAEKRHHGSGMLLSVEAGQEAKDLLFHMAPTAVITGKITDIDGDPIPNVSVAALPPHFSRNRISTAVGEGSTNDLGEYRISDLAPDRYMIVAQGPSYLARPAQSAKPAEKTLVYGTTYYPGTTEKNHAVSLDVHAGDEMPANITLGLVHLFHVRGEVKNLPPVRNDEVNIVLRPLDEEFMGNAPSGQVDHEGRFDMGGVLPGSYRILLVLGASLHPSVMRGDQTVQVTSADVEGLRISSVPNGQVRGRFRLDNGEKIDWSELEVSLYSRLQVTSWPGGGGGASLDAFYWDQQPAHAALKSDGSFEMTSVPPDTYRVSVWSMSNAFNPYFVKAVRLGGKDVIDSGFSVGDAAYSLDITIGANGATVEGFVVDDKGPASDVLVCLVPGDEQRQRRDLYHSTFTDTRGHFRVAGLNPGEFLLFAVDQDVAYPDLLDPEFIRKHDSSGETVELKEGEVKSIQLKLTPSGD
jgi:hypothetical protein